MINIADGAFSAAVTLLSFFEFQHLPAERRHPGLWQPKQVPATSRRKPRWRRLLAMWRRYAGRGSVLLIAEQEIARQPRPTGFRQCRTCEGRGGPQQPARFEAWEAHLPLPGSRPPHHSLPTLDRSRHGEGGMSLSRGRSAGAALPSPSTLAGSSSCRAASQGEQVAGPVFDTSDGQAGNLDGDTTVEDRNGVEHALPRTSCDFQPKPWRTA